MNDRKFKSSANPTKNQELAITFNGKTWAICSPEQMDYILIRAKEQLIFNAYEEQQTITEEQLAEKMKEFSENCGFATLDYVLGKMTPAEQEEWKNKYRFTPFTKAWK